ncbi:MAG: metabolite traffic protein EboE [Nitrospiraceae bacterium]
MRLGINGRPHLTYCTNIHSGETWPEIRRNLDEYVLKVRARIAPDRPYGIGLRLSGQAAASLSDPTTLAEFLVFLRAHSLYVFTINGFPHGTFHGTRVKEKVYLPDWLDDERLRYADQMAHLLAALLVDHPEIEGSISTVPGAFKARVRTLDDRAQIAERLLRHAATLHRIAQSTGRTIVCALEPEPCCLLETTDETVEFFTSYLFSTRAIETFAAMTGLSPSAAEATLRRHLGVCLDACHAAVEFEEPAAALAALEKAGIRIAKIQLSTGLRVARLDRTRLDALRPFAESTYLHQVVQRHADTLTRYDDLPAAMDAVERTLREGADDIEWRIHFHVPLFLAQLGLFENTQRFLAQLLVLQRARVLTAHLEVEAYTWDVLPEQYRGMPVVDAIAREMDWVIGVLTR